MTSRSTSTRRPLGGVGAPAAAACASGAEAKTPGDNGKLYRRVLREQHRPDQSLVA